MSSPDADESPVMATTSGYMRRLKDLMEDVRRFAGMIIRDPADEVASDRFQDKVNESFPTDEVEHAIYHAVRALFHASPHHFMALVRNRGCNHYIFFTNALTIIRWFGVDEYISMVVNKEGEYIVNPRINSEMYRAPEYGGRGGRGGRGARGGRGRGGNRGGTTVTLDSIRELIRSELHAERGPVAPKKKHIHGDADDEPRRVQSTRKPILVDDDASDHEVKPKVSQTSRAKLTRAKVREETSADTPDVKSPDAKSPDVKSPPKTKLTKAKPKDEPKDELTEDSPIQEADEPKTPTLKPKAKAKAASKVAAKPPADSTKDVVKEASEPTKIEKSRSWADAVEADDD